MPAELTELARALHHDPKLIYDYVHNIIDYIPYYGALKGPLLTYLDGSGNDYDQASLLVTLLRQSGYTANYVQGTMTIPGETMANWLGVDWDDQTINAALSANGISVEALYTDGTVTIERVWVKATIDGTAYLFDPAIKNYQDIAALVDIETTAGYNRAELLAAVTEGATIGSNFTQNLNESALTNKLVEYTSSLLTTLNQQYPNRHLDEIIGGRNIIQASLNEYTTSLPYVMSETALWQDIPVEKTATLSISHLGMSYSFSIPDIAAKRLTMTYSATEYRPELRLDGELLATGSTSSQGMDNSCLITVDHPYARDNGTYMDQTSTYTLVSGATYAFTSNYGGHSSALIAKRQKKLEQSIATGLTESSESVLGESLNIMGLSWMQQCRMAAKLQEKLTETISVLHHRIGIMAQEEGGLIDVKTAFSSDVSKNADNEAASVKDEYAQFFVSSSLISAFEHAIFEQLDKDAVPGISTIKLLQQANAGGSKIFHADQNTFSSVLSQLSNYSSSTLADLQTEINQGRSLILPASGNLSFNEWQGAGYITIQNSASGKYLGMMLSGGYYGGQSSIASEIDPGVVSDNAALNISGTLSPWTAIDRLTTTPTPLASDPVEMAGGAFVHDHTDLFLGKSPMGSLTFNRSYSSGRHLTNHGLGFGWTHNYNISLSQASHAEPGLGGRQAREAAAMLIALAINSDLLKNEDTLLGWMIVSLVHKWAVDQLINNTATIHLGKKIIEFVRLADGTYSPPPGLTAQLTENSTTFSLRERFGATINFNEAGKASQVSDIHGNTLLLSYADSRLESVVDSYGRTMTLDYMNDLLTSVSDPSGRTVGFDYDLNGNLTSFTDAAGKVWQYNYDHLHRLTTFTSPLDITTVTNSYDSLGRVQKQTVPRQNGEANYEFFFSGYRNIQTDPAGNQTIYSFDKMGRNIAIENTLGHTSSTEYDGQDHVLKMISPRSTSTEFQFDGDHNLVKITNAALQENNFQYDTQHRLTQITDPLGHTSNFSHSDTHQPVMVSIFPGSGQTLSTTADYTASGQVSSITDARQTSTVYTYDGYGSRASSTTGSQPSITYTHDQLGRLLSLTDQAGTTTNFAYDPRGRLERRTDGLGQATFATYYNDGKLHQVTDRNNQTTTLTYIPSGKIDTITYEDGATVSHNYDIHDRLTARNDSLGQTTFVYDAAGQLTSKTDPHGFTIGYGYDESGNVIEITYPGGKSVSYGYTTLNQLQTVTDWLGQTATYSYDAAGRLISLHNFNGTITTYAYDNANRMTGLSVTEADSTVIASYNFTLDENGNRVGIEEQAPLRGVITAEEIIFAYNQAKNRLVGVGGKSLSYDNEGQLTAKGSDTFVFDAAHRLKEIAVSQAMNFSYDGTGNRLSANRNGITTRYIYDAAGNLLAEADASNAITAYYIHGAGLLAMVTPAGQPYCYHFDATGNTIAMSDSTGAVVNAYSYTPFGTLLSQEETFAQPFKYVGQYGVMAETNGFYYMRARYYDPHVRRFISEDPLSFGGGDVNLYAYVKNNPIMLVDPSGLAAYSVPFQEFSPNYAVNGTTYNGAFIVTSIEPVSNSVELIEPLTDGQQNALMLTTGGLTAIGIGAFFENPAMIGSGITMASEGALLSTIEFGFDGDTSLIPTPWEIISDITNGIMSDIPGHSSTSTNNCPR